MASYVDYLKSNFNLSGEALERAITMYESKSGRSASEPFEYSTPAAVASGVPDQPVSQPAVNTYEQMQQGQTAPAEFMMGSPAYDLESSPDYGGITAGSMETWFAGVQGTEIAPILTGMPPLVGGPSSAFGLLSKLPGILGTIGTIGLAGYGAYEAVNDWIGIDPSGAGSSVEYGGNGNVTMQNTMPYGIAGPGVQEPADGTWEKRWSIAVNSEKFGGTWRVYFWKMWDGYTLCFNPRTGGWKRYKPRKNIVLSSDPRISNISRAVRATEGKLKRLSKRTKRLQYKA